MVSPNHGLNAQGAREETIILFSVILSKNLYQRFLRKAFEKDLEISYKNYPQSWRCPLTSHPTQNSPQMDLRKRKRRSFKLSGENMKFWGYSKASWVRFSSVSCNWQVMNIFLICLSKHFFLKGFLSNSFASFIYNSLQDLVIMLIMLIVA